MMLQLVAMYCNHVYVWCPWHSSHIWLWSWQTKGHTAREQLHTAVQQPPPGTASISTWLTYTLKYRVKVRVLMPSSGNRRLPSSVSYPIDISSSITSFCRMPVFSPWFANCRQTQQGEQMLLTCFMPLLYVCLTFLGSTPERWA